LDAASDDPLTLSDSSALRQSISFSDAAAALL
jgi:hypothetical protein